MPKQVVTGIVYKYARPERVDVLENGYIRFTQLNALNDPFEALPSFCEFRSGAIEQMKEFTSAKFGKSKTGAIEPIFPEIVDDFVRQLPDTLSRKFAFLSLSKRRDNLVMWSHYADSHRGFVLGLFADNRFFKPGNGKGRHGLCEVSYSNKRVILPRRAYPRLGLQGAHDLNDVIFYTKSTHWAYEEEVRIVGDPEAADRTESETPTIPIHLFKLPSECVAEIILGHRMDTDYVARFRTILAEHYRGAQLLRARVDDEVFELRIEPDAG